MTSDEILSQKHYPCILTRKLHPESKLIEVEVGIISEYRSRIDIGPDIYTVHVSKEALEQFIHYRLDEEFGRKRELDKIIIMCNPSSDWDKLEPEIIRYRLTSSKNEIFKNIIPIPDFVEPIIKKVEEQELS